MKVLRLILACTLLLTPGATFAATLDLAPSSTSVTVGNIVTVRLSVNAAGTAINQSGATLQFPSNLLEVLSVSKANSVFSLWVEEPSYSNAAGTISFDGGVPNPGFSGSSGTVLTVSFRAKQPGTASLILADAAVRANDGFGTDVLTRAGSAQLSLVSPVVVPVAPTPVAAPVENAPTPAPAAVTTPKDILLTNLTSPTHPFENAWYTDVNPRVSWDLARSVTSVQMIVSEEEDTAPAVTYTPAINEKKIDALTDGIWYFNIRAKAGDTWAPTQTYRLQIDATPPTLAKPVFVYDAATQTVRISGIDGADETSGILRYEIAIGDQDPVEIAPEEIVDRSYVYTYKKDGGWLQASAHVASSGGELVPVVFTAVDRAGNRTDVTGEFVVPESVGGSTIGTFYGLQVTILGFMTFVLIIALLALTASLLALWHLWASRTKRKKRTGKRDVVLHRSLTLFKEDIERHLASLEKAHGSRKLTPEEIALKKDLASNVDDLERYLTKELKKLD